MTLLFAVAVLFLILVTISHNATIIIVTSYLAVWLFLLMPTLYLTIFFFFLVIVTMFGNDFILHNWDLMSHSCGFVFYNCDNVSQCDFIFHNWNYVSQCDIIPCNFKFTIYNVTLHLTIVTVSHKCEFKPYKWDKWVLVATSYIAMWLCYS